MKRTMHIDIEQKEIIECFGTFFFTVKCKEGFEKHIKQYHLGNISFQEMKKSVEIESTKEQTENLKAKYLDELLSNPGDDLPF